MRKREKRSRVGLSAALGGARAFPFRSLPAACPISRLPLFGVASPGMSRLAYKRGSLTQQYALGHASYTALTS